MFKQIVFLALVGAAFGAPKLRHLRGMDGRIVGGVDAQINDFPWQASLQWYGSHICGASIISEQYIVTAAHCTDGESASALTIRVNTSVAETGGQVVKVKKINQNPKYDDSIIDFDISILELDTPLTLGDGIQAIKLPAAGETLEAGTEVTVSGWGTLNEDDWDISSKLQEVQVSVVSPADCQAAYAREEITERMLCAGVPEGGKDSCSGDSGGPLEVDGTLWGIVSWGYGCARAGYPGVYGSVAALRDFITEITGL